MVPHDHIYREAETELVPFAADGDSESIAGGEDVFRSGLSTPPYRRRRSPLQTPSPPTISQAFALLKALLDYFHSASVAHFYSPLTLGRRILLRLPGCAALIANARREHQDLYADQNDTRRTDEVGGHRLAAHPARIHEKQENKNEQLQPPVVNGAEPAPF